MTTQLESSESVTKSLQENNSPVSDSRTLFDVVIEKFLATVNRFSTFGDITQNPVFENAVVKHHRGSLISLLGEELKSFRKFTIE